MSKPSSSTTPSSSSYDNAASSSSSSSSSVAGSSVSVVPIPDREGPRADPWNFMFDVHHNPCFRHSLLWGGGLGTTMGIHSFIRHRSQGKAINAFFGTFILTSGIAWYFCREPQIKEQRQMRMIVEKMREKQEREDAAAAKAKSTNSK